MCVVSMIGDHYRDNFPNRPYWPSVEPHVQPTPVILPSPISREEFDALKQDVQEMKELLKRAKAYDERNHEPDCEVEEKMDLLRRIARVVGVDLSDVIGE